MSDETWKAIKEAVSMAMSADCECDGGLAECVPCRRWSEVQAAMVRESDQYDSISATLNTLGITLMECADAIESGEHRKENEGWQVTVECSDYDKAAGILRARLRTTKEMKYIAMGLEFKEEDEG